MLRKVKDMRDRFFEGEIFTAKFILDNPSLAFMDYCERYLNCINSKKWKGEEKGTIQCVNLQGIAGMSRLKYIIFTFQCKKESWNINIIDGEETEEIKIYKEINFSEIPPMNRIL